ncbi:modin [Colletotrichum plurivorum]|uniref:Modin n=1 Tax=Colletotrichum plurivorum TaxID=2175906 RepID=A0A8H6JVG1_9PEZI|nr:modin [Colletotrichum plurivorum]
MIQGRQVLQAMLGDDDLAEPLLAIAFVTVLLPCCLLLFSISQVMFTIAPGLPSCDKRAMGGWTVHTRTRLRGIGLRPEVHFRSPIITVGSPDPEVKPNTQQKRAAEGTKKSCEMSHVKHDEMNANTEHEDSLRWGHHRATWVSLVEVIERMERDPRAWERRFARTRWDPWGLPVARPTLAVCFQAAQRSFDINTPVKKPYATTTISHMVELAAVLNIYWKVLDRRIDIYRAEGNGCVLVGSRIANLGIVFTFERTQPAIFGRRRIIPMPEVKELVFGRVPTIFRPKAGGPHNAMWQNPLKTSSRYGGVMLLKPEVLQLGSAQDVAQTLLRIGCSGRVTALFKRKNQHLFPVVFELVGMLARTLHVKGQYFTHLPNPAGQVLGSDSFSMLNLFCFFASQFSLDASSLFGKFEKTWFNIKGDESDIARIRYMAQAAERLLSVIASRTSNHGNTATEVGNYWHEALEIADSILASTHHAIVLDVVRCHIEEVLETINEPRKKNAGKLWGQPRPESNSGYLVDESKEDVYIQLLFQRIVWRVVSLHSTSGARVGRETASKNIHTWSETRSTQADAEEIQVLYPWWMEFEFGEVEKLEPWRRLASRAALRQPPKWKDRIRNEDEMLRLKVWYALVFRMLCWLLLHQFDKNDKQLPSSDLMGSTQPVFIV